MYNAARSEQKIFEGKLDFKIEILSYDLKTDYIEDTLVELEKCYNSENIPPSIHVAIHVGGKKKHQNFSF